MFVIAVSVALGERIRKLSVLVLELKAKSPGRVPKPYRQI